MKILIDTNVILDIFQKREPFFPNSYQALHKAIEAESECLVSASSATDIFYMLRKSLRSADQAKERIEQLSKMICCSCGHAGGFFKTALKQPKTHFHNTLIIK